MTRQLIVMARDRTTQEERGLEGETPNARHPFLEGHPKFQACPGPRSALDVGSPSHLLEPGNDRLDDPKGVRPNPARVEAAAVVFDHEPQPITDGLEKDI